MSSRFEHEPSPDPVIIFDEMLPFLAHILTNKLWPAFLHESYRISASVSVYTVEDVFWHVNSIIGYWFIGSFVHWFGISFYYLTEFAVN